MVSSGWAAVTWAGSGNFSAKATYPGDVTIKLGTATAMSTNSRSIHPAGRLTVPLLSTRAALARRLIPFGLRGQTPRLPCLILTLLRCRGCGGRRHRAVPANRLRAQQNANVDPPAGRALGVLSKSCGAHHFCRLPRQTADRRFAGGR